ncbi:dodecin family protein [Bradyrhizobium sp. 25ACV]
MRANRIVPVRGRLKRDSQVDAFPSIRPERTRWRRSGSSFGAKSRPSASSLSLLGSVRNGISVEILMLDFLGHTEQEDDMPDSVYKVIELVGTSSDSWEKAAANAVEQAAKSLRDLRVAEVIKLDMQLDENGKVEAYRAKLSVSFKFEGS